MENTADNRSIRLLTRAEAAARLSEQGFPTAKSTLAKLACIGGGPEFQKFGSRALYSPENLISWAESKLSGPLRSTSEGVN